MYGWSWCCSWVCIYHRRVSIPACCGCYCSLTVRDTICLRLRHSAWLLWLLLWCALLLLLRLLRLLLLYLLHILLFLLLQGQLHRVPLLQVVQVVHQAAQLQQGVHPVQQRRHQLHVLPLPRIHPQRPAQLKGQQGGCWHSGLSCCHLALCIIADLSTSGQL
jgi:hypothetical protein